METKRKSIYNREADKKYCEANREHRAYLQDRSKARTFIKNKATLQDLEELKEFIRIKEIELNIWLFLPIRI